MSPLRYTRKRSRWAMLLRQYLQPSACFRRAKHSQHFKHDSRKPPTKSYGRLSEVWNPMKKPDARSTSSSVARRRRIPSSLGPVAYSFRSRPIAWIEVPARFLDTRNAWRSLTLGCEELRPRLQAPRASFPPTTKEGCRSSLAPFSRIEVGCTGGACSVGTNITSASLSRGTPTCHGR